MSQPATLNYLWDYEEAVDAYAAAVRVLIATKAASEFAQAMIAVNAAHAKSEELLFKFEWPLKRPQKSRLNRTPTTRATLLSPCAISSRACAASSQIP